MKYNVSAAGAFLRASTGGVWQVSTGGERPQVSAQPPDSGGQHGGRGPVCVCCLQKRFSFVTGQSLITDDTPQTVCWTTSLPSSRWLPPAQPSPASHPREGHQQTSPSSSQSSAPSSSCCWLSSWLCCVVPLTTRSRPHSPRQVLTCSLQTVGAKQKRNIPPFIRDQRVQNDGDLANFIWDLKCDI